MKKLEMYSKGFFSHQMAQKSFEERVAVVQNPHPHKKAWPAFSCAVQETRSSVDVCWFWGQCVMAEKKEALWEVLWSEPFLTEENGDRPQRAAQKLVECPSGPPTAFESLYTGDCLLYML